MGVTRAIGLAVLAVPAAAAAAVAGPSYVVPPPGAIIIGGQSISVGPRYGVSGLSTIIVDGRLTFLLGGNGLLLPTSSPVGVTVTQIPFACALAAGGYPGFSCAQTAAGGGVQSAQDVAATIAQQIAADGGDYGRQTLTPPSTGQATIVTGQTAGGFAVGNSAAVTASSVQDGAVGGVGGALLGVGSGQGLIVVQPLATVTIGGSASGSGTVVLGGSSGTVVPGSSPGSTGGDILPGAPPASGSGLGTVVVSGSGNAGGTNSGTGGDILPGAPPASGNGNGIVVVGSGNQPPVGGGSGSGDILPSGTPASSGGPSRAFVTVQLASSGYVVSAVRGTLFAIDPATSAVPEPATWASMVAGFALIGAGLRRRRARTRISLG